MIPVCLVTAFLFATGGASGPGHHHLRDADYGASLQKQGGKLRGVSAVLVAGVFPRAGQHHRASERQPWQVA